MKYVWIILLLVPKRAGRSVLLTKGNMAMAEVSELDKRETNSFRQSFFESNFE